MANLFKPAVEELKRKKMKKMREKVYYDEFVKPLHDRQQFAAQ